MFSLSVPISLFVSLIRCQRHVATYTISPFLKLIRLYLSIFHNLIVQFIVLYKILFWKRLRMRCVYNRLRKIQLEYNEWNSFIRLQFNFAAISSWSNDDQHIILKWLNYKSHHSPFTLNSSSPISEWGHKTT